MAEQRYIQKGWEIDSITPIFKDDPSASEVGTIESVYVVTEEEWAKWRASGRADVSEPTKQQGDDIFTCNCGSDLYKRIRRA